MTETFLAVSHDRTLKMRPLWRGSNVPRTREVDELELARELVRRARAAGVALIGPGGLLKAMAKTAIEIALDEELSEHGYAPSADRCSREPKESSRRHANLTKSY